MNLNHRPPGPALGAQWTFAFCKLLILKDWSGRMDLNHRPPGPEPGALARLRYAPTVTLGCIVATQAGLSDYHSSALPGYRRVAVPGVPLQAAAVDPRGPASSGESARGARGRQP